jgi:cytochrome c-type biogenesis protein CcmH/NrfF
MKKRILVEDRPPLEGETLLIFALPLAIALLAGLTLSVILW